VDHEERDGGRAVGKLTEQRDRQKPRFVAYKGHVFSDREARVLIIRALDARALPVIRITAAPAESRSPRHPDFAWDGKTGWRLFNLVTEALKEGSNMDLPRWSQALHGLMDLAGGQTLPAVMALPADPHLAQAV
jgi:hypothetical protein